MQTKIFRKFVLAGAILGIIILSLYSMSIHPQQVALSDLSEFEGEYVIVEAQVIEVYDGTYGSSLTLIQENTTAQVFLETQDHGIEIGDLIQVMGKVSSYQGSYSISVGGRGTYSILEHWETESITLPAISREPWAYRDLNVNLSCRVLYGMRDSDSSSYFTVCDRNLSNYTLLVYVYGRDVQRAYEGANVSISMRIEYRAEKLDYVGYIDSDEHHVWLMDDVFQDG